MNRVTPHMYILLLLAGVLALVCPGCADVLHIPYGSMKNAPDESVYVGAQPVTCYVWLHGTVGSSVNIFNPRACLDDTACDDTLSVRLSTAYRHYKDIGNDQPIPRDHGVFLLDRADLDKANAGTLAEDKRYEAIYAIAAAYDACEHHFSGQDRGIRVHALAGWSGLLSQKERRREGFLLYHNLCRLRRQLVHEYQAPVKFVIISHSHGGNVALWMAEAESLQHEGLSIDTLIMLGTPIQRETGHCITSPFFKTVILYSSQGDNVQGLDYFSTIERRSYKRMSDVADIQTFVDEHPSYIRADVSCMVNNYDKHVSHVNMWFIRRSEAAIPDMWPLPFVSTIPAFREGFISPLTYYRACVLDTPEESCCSLEGWSHDQWVLLLQRSNMRPLWQSLAQLAWKCWTPVDEQTHIIFNRKNFDALRHAWRTVRRKKQPIQEAYKQQVQEQREREEAHGEYCCG